MEADEFNNYKDALVEQKLERDHSLLDETDSHWEQIFDQRCVLLKSLLTPTMLVSGTLFCKYNGATYIFVLFLVSKTLMILPLFY